MINYDGATTYFAAESHPQSKQWSEFDEADRMAAIAEARRQLARYLGRAMDDNEAEYAEGDTARDEYAVYEQSMHILMNTVLPNAQNSGPAFASQSASDEPRVKDDSEFGPAALRWLAMSFQAYPTVSLSRG
jgi:hypothetical protein